MQGSISKKQEKIGERQENNLKQYYWCSKTRWNSSHYGI